MNSEVESRPPRSWRNWSLPVKLGAMMLVPVVFAVTLSVTAIHNQVGRVAEFDRITDVFTAVDQVERLVAELHAERQRAVERLTGSAGVGELDRQVDVVDRTADQVTRTFARTEFDQLPTARYRDARTALDKLPELREQARSGQVDPPMTIDSYTTITRAVLSLDQALTDTVGERGLASNAASMQQILVMMEEVRLQQAWALYGMASGELDTQAREGILASRARLAGKIGEALATLEPYWHDRLAGVLAHPGVTRRNAQLDRMVSQPDNVDASAAGQWNASSEKVVASIHDGQRELATVVRGKVAALRDEAGNAAGRDSVILLFTLLIAAAIGTAVARQLLGSLRQLRSSALAAAETELPSAVDTIRRGKQVDEDLPPVPVRTTDEVGQVARAFDEVNQQALRLASEQATLRRGHRDSFVGVSRRSQNLLERQLVLFEQLEQDEEDPDQLARLFQLDHLATRMRRNNENLMVLSGSDLVRRFTQPTPLADVLQAAVAEIEQYPRITVQPPPRIAVVGYVASDLVRLLAELFDNAANFSAPDTVVTVSSALLSDGSITLDVVDEGIGMDTAELAGSNERLRVVGEDDPATSRRMGLFVVARLAARHGVGVRLHGGSDVEGIRAAVHIPVEHVVGHDRPSAVSDGQGMNGEPLDHRHSDQLANTHSSDYQTGAVGAAPVSLPTQASELSTGLFTTGADEFSGASSPGFPVEFAPDGPPGPLREPVEPEDGTRMNLFEPMESTQEYSADELRGVDEPRGAVAGDHELRSGFDIPRQPRNPVRGLEESRPAEPSATPWFQPSDDDYQWPREDAGAQSAGSSADAADIDDPAAERRSPGELSRRFAERYSGIHFGLDPVESANNGTARGSSAEDRVESYTSSGLPRRDPGARLVPGSMSGSTSVAGGGQDGEASAEPRDPGRLRGRLSDFQSGVQRGKHRLTDEEGME